MKYINIKAIFAAITLTIAGFANAGLMHTFVYDDLSDWSSIQNFSVGDSLTITFRDSTDFNDVNWADIESFKYNLVAGSTKTINVENFTATVGDPTEAFSELNGDVIFSYSGVFTDSLLAGYGNGDSQYYAQISPAGYEAAFIHLFNDSGVFTAFAWLKLDPDSTSVIRYTSKSQEVPEPTTLAIFALGIIGLASRRFKKQY